MMLIDKICASSCRLVAAGFEQKAADALAMVIITHLDRHDYSEADLDDIKARLEKIRTGKSAANECELG